MHREKVLVGQMNDKDGEQTGALLLRGAIYNKGVKVVASTLGVSSSLVYKWCQDKDKDDSAHNPLEHLCRRFDGKFQTHTHQTREPLQSLPATEATKVLLSSFSRKLESITTSFNDSSISAKEGLLIRSHLEAFRETAEKFVGDCELGVFDSASDTALR